MHVLAGRCPRAAGDVDAAEQLYQRLLGVGNDLGLFAEKHDPTSGELFGNFPQAFTHLGVIQSAYHLLQARAEAASGKRPAHQPDDHDTARAS